MLSRKPTAIKLTREDIQDYDNLVAARKEAESSKNTSNTSKSAKPHKGKEVTSTAEERQAAMDERIGVTTATRGPRR